MRTTSVMMAAQLVQSIATGNKTVDRIIDDAADRAENVADYLEKIEKNVNKEKDNELHV